MKPPSERQWVTIGLFAFAVGMLLMARENPKLWDVKLFEVTFQAIVLTGILNMVVAFHFAANKSDETKSENTRAAFDAITATANANTVSDAATGKPDDPVHTVEETKP